TASLILGFVINTRYQMAVTCASANGIGTRRPPGVGTAPLPARDAEGRALGRDDAGRCASGARPRPRAGRLRRVHRRTVGRGLAAPGGLRRRPGDRGHLLPPGRARGPHPAPLPRRARPLLVRRQGRGVTMNRTTLAVVLLLGVAWPLFRARGPGR